MKAVLDLSAHSRFITGDPEILDVLSAASHGLVPAVVLGDRHRDFRRTARRQENEQLLPSAPPQTVPLHLPKSIV